MVGAKMNGATKMFLLLIAVVFLTTNAQAQQSRTFYDSTGRVSGRSTTDSGGSSTFYGASGRVTGRRSAGSNGTTTIYDGAGRRVGTTSRSR
jgi:YD repeat-containing protein